MDGDRYCVTGQRRCMEAKRDKASLHYVRGYLHNKFINAGLNIAAYGADLRRGVADDGSPRNRASQTCGTHHNGLARTCGVVGGVGDSPAAGEVVDRAGAPTEMIASIDAGVGVDNSDCIRRACLPVRRDHKRGRPQGSIEGNARLQL